MKYLVYPLAICGAVLLAGCGSMLASMESNPIEDDPGERTAAVEKRFRSATHESLGESGAGSGRGNDQNRTVSECPYCSHYERDQRQVNVEH